MRVAPAVALTPEERRQLDAWVRGRSTARALAERARIVLAAGQGKTNLRIAEELRLRPGTVGLWRRRFVTLRLAGIDREAPRPGAKPRLPPEVVRSIVEKTLRGGPPETGRWTVRSLAEEMGVHYSTISRIWSAYGLGSERRRAVEATESPARQGRASRARTLARPITAGLPATLPDAGGSHPAVGASTLLPQLRRTSARAVRARTVPLVGRETEFETLRAWIEGDSNRSDALSVVVGEAGIGKTRLLEEARAYASSRGWLCLSARCGDGSRGVAYGPWMDIVRSFVDRQPRDQVFRAVRPFFDALARLVPELADKVWLVPDPGARAAEFSPYRFLRDLTGFLVSLGTLQRTLIVLDDLALADAASFEVLQQLVADPGGRGAVVLASARDSDLEAEPTLRALLEELARAKVAMRVEPRRLARPQVDLLVAGLLDHAEAPPDLADFVYRKTEGNPFFVEEVLHSLIEDRALVRDSSGWHLGSVTETGVPSLIRDTIRQRLARLDEKTRLTLRAASILGTEFPLDRLRRVLHLPPSQVIPALERAVEAKLLVEKTGDMGRIAYAFAHPLIAEVLYADLGAPRRAELHRRVARALEVAAELEAGERDAALAYHYLRAGDAPRALRYSIRSGERAASVFARAEAIQHYEVARKLLRERPPSAELWRVDNRLAEQKGEVGDVREATLLFEEAARGFEVEGSPVDAAACLLNVEGLRHAHVPPKPEESLLDRARTLLVGHEDTAIYVSWLGFEGERAGQAGRFAEAEERHRELLAIAERNGLSYESAMAQATLAEYLPIERRDEGFRLVEIARRIAEQESDARVGSVGSPHAGLAGVLPYILAYHAGNLLHLLGDAAGSVAALNEAAEIARKVGRRFDMYGWGEEFLRGFLLPWSLLRLGDFAGARTLAESREQFLREHGSPDRLDSVVLRAAIGVHCGRDREEAANLLRESFERLEATPCWPLELEARMAFARLERSRDRLDAAKDHLDAAAARCRAAGPPAWYALRYAEVLAMDVEAGLGIGRADEARERLSELEDLARRFDAEPILAFLDAARARLWAHDSRRSEAEAAFERCLGIWERLGWKYELAWTWAELGSLHASGSDPARATLAHDRALELFRQMGATADADRVSASRAGATPA